MIFDNYSVDEQRGRIVPGDKLEVSKDDSSQWVLEGLQENEETNTDKVREVIEPPNITGLPESHVAVMGVFRLRESVTPLVDLADRLIAESSIAAVQASAVATPVAI